MIGLIHSRLCDIHSGVFGEARSTQCGTTLNKTFWRKGSRKTIVLWTKRSWVLLLLNYSLATLFIKNTIIATIDFSHKYRTVCKWRSLSTPTSQAEEHIWKTSRQLTSRRTLKNPNLTQLLLLNIVFGEIIPSTQCTGLQECEMGIKHLISDWAEAKALASSQAHTEKLSLWIWGSWSSSLRSFVSSRIAWMKATLEKNIASCKTTN